MRKNSNVSVDRERCTGCGACVSLCPRKILYIDKEGKCAVNIEPECDRLKGCERSCPADAIKIN
ncbi:MAG: 4Fe-4S binding protein [Elusimicrobia bacterium]|nr:4Fe-4S binding protein [Elusimicrobiota bacterium]